MWRGPIVALLLLVCCLCLLEAADREDVASVKTRRNARESALSTFATEVEDLLGEGNSPGKQRKTAKNDARNTSGKSDEGGYYKTYGSDAEGEKGYLTATYSKGNHGYKTLDTFHKQDGDKYAFEKHVAYGKARADKKSSHNDEEGSSRSGKAGDHEGADTIVDTHYATYESDHRDDGGEYYGEADGSHTHEDDSHYTDDGPESSNYEHGESYRDGEHGSYGSHSSYSRSTGDEHDDNDDHYY